MKDGAVGKRGGGVKVGVQFTVFSQLSAPAFILNLASWTRHLFDTRSLLELSSLIFTDRNHFVISEAFYTSNKNFRGLFKTPPLRHSIYSKPGV